MIELMIVLVLSAAIVSGIYAFMSKQRKTSSTERLKADIESLAQVSFFIMGRDIRRAGSNPKGWGAFVAGQPITFEEATTNKLVIRADLDGDGVVTDGTDEKVTYEYVDDPENPDGIPDQIRRQAGNQLVIQNVRSFDLCYWMVGGFWDCTPGTGDEPLIRKVRMRLVAGTGRQNSATGEEDTKEIQTVIRLRNFDL